MGEHVRGNSRLIRGLNTSLVLDVLRSEGPLSRSSIARKTGISNPSVSQLIAQLLDRGVVEELGKAPSTGGRPATLVKFNPKAGYLIGVDVGAEKITGGVVDLSGDIVTSLSTHTMGPFRATARLEELIENLLSVSHVPLEDIWGIGLGVPGVTDCAGQKITLIPGLDWDNLNVGKWLNDRFSVPIWADNDTNAVVLGEHWKGSLRHVQHGLCVNIGTGIGVGMLLDGQVFRGKAGAAGEVGYWVNHFEDARVHSNAFGPLESFAAGPGIVRRANEGLGLREPGVNHVASKRFTNAKEVFDSAAKGDRLARGVVDGTIKALGIVIANMATLLDVEKVVLTGGVSRAGRVLLDPIRAMLQERVPFPPDIVISELQEKAGILGCAFGVLEQRTNHIRYSTYG